MKATLGKTSKRKEPIRAASRRLSYSLPLMDIPNIKMATGATLEEIICRPEDKGEGISTLSRLKDTPRIMDNFNGFLDKRDKISLNKYVLDLSFTKVSNTINAIMNPKVFIEDTDKAASRSASKES